MTLIFTGENQQANAAVEKITIRGILAHDAVGIGFGAEPDSYNSLKSMIANDPDNRTGWSGFISVCNNSLSVGTDGKPILDPETGKPISPWEEKDRGNTDDSGRDKIYNVSDYQKEIVAKYGPEVYEKALKSGKSLGYETGTKTEIYSKNHHPLPCTDGQEGFYYNNFDFNLTMTFEVKMEEPVIPPLSDAKVTGKVYWELQRLKDDEPSYVVISSAFQIPEGKHYATREEYHLASYEGAVLKEPSPISVETPGMPLKGSTLSYGFEYEYTDEPIGWECHEWEEDEDGDEDCVDWQFNKDPDWEKVEYANFSDSMKIDHSQGEKIKASSLTEILKKKWVVGRMDVFGPSKTSSVYHERYRKADDNDRKDVYNLKTQTTLPMTPGKLIYEVELPSGAHENADFYPLKKSQSSGFYRPVEVDESLREDYKK
ncbi:hypothetical protein H7992_04965 [Sporosarcina sp. resist]|uniref:hypothetical protein n=1 Tax=Sporosarcina sp. resist TaxID=2762563 RepID=UPI00164E7901|nr:hypothetical protein [Sporosarcina sp. resist]QNK89079.1 hypothetical protein H7992_04965 [Sporosarcina sp. resist]